MADSHGAPGASPPIMVDKTALPANTANTIHMIAMVAGGVLISRLLPQSLIDQFGGDVVREFGGLAVLAAGAGWRYLRTWRSHKHLKFLADLLPDQVVKVKP